jgi:predicted glycosyltransferase
VRILVDILHPKHVHFFRPLIRRWQQRGDVVQILTRDKDITHQLLEQFGLPFVCLSRQQKSWRMAGELLQRWARVMGWLRQFRPDLTMAIGAVTMALPSRLLGVPHLAFTDTETATLGNRLGLPFANRILTPAWFTHDFGPRHFRYQGFHEWSYLHPTEFTPDPEVVRAEGIEPNEPYAVVRFVRWSAAHDQGEAGLSPADAVTLVQELSRRMRVYLTSEVSPPPVLQPFVARVRVDRMHHVLAFARLMAGESPSMGTEAALLGVPAVVASTWAGRCGNMQVLEQEFGLMKVCTRGQDAVRAALELADNPPSRQQIAAQRAALVRRLEYIPEVIERHIQALRGGTYG